MFRYMWAVTAVQIRPQNKGGGLSLCVCAFVLCQLTPSMSRPAAELNSCQCALFAAGWKVQMLQSSGNSQPPSPCCLAGQSR